VPLAARRHSLTRFAAPLLAASLPGCASVEELLGVIADAAPALASDGAAGDGATTFDATVVDGADVRSEAEADVRTEAASGDAGSLCDFSSPFGVPMLVTGFQSNTAEGGFRLLPDELTGFFWSSRAGGPGATNLFVTTRPDAGVPFGGAKLLANVNVPNSLTIDPTATANGLTLLYRVKSGSPDSGTDLLMAATRGDAGIEFANGASLVNVNGNAHNVQPFVSPDGLEMYFASDRAGSFEIYRATRGSTAFGPPSLVSELSQAGAAENDPVLSADGLTILFSSSRGGAQDIWVAQRPNKSSLFGPPFNLKEVNSPGADAPTWLSPDGCRLFLSSDRNNNGVHIYLATRQ
jgi:WD40-like Beta Propeller Repeat